jgi:hypothetical protein
LRFAVSGRHGQRPAMAPRERPAGAVRLFPPV